MRRREEAQSATNLGIDGTPKVLSIIIDIMDQSKCRVPDIGMQGVFSDPFDQMIVGVKVISMRDGA